MAKTDSSAPRAAIFGATSDIATALARRYARRHARLVLVGRDRGRLDALAADLRVRGAAEVCVQQADFTQLVGLPIAADKAWHALGGLDVAVIAYGSLPDQAAVQSSAQAAMDELTLNFVSPAGLLGELAQRFEIQQAGTIAVITSVAGDRGRRSNYVYGAAKGGLQRLLEGLRHRLHSSGVAVLDIRPGFVATRMTAHLPRTGPLWGTPDQVAADIDSAIAAGREVLYTPWFWRPVMAVVRGVPRIMFHRTSL